MKSPLVLTRLLALAILFSAIASGQQSDYAIKKGFEEGYASLFQRLEAATAVGTLDSLKGEVDAFEQAYAPHAGFLDKAIYPETFADRIRSLRTMHSLTYERVYLITTQGVKIEELETKILYLTTKLDTLTAQRERLLEELAEAKRSNSQLRDVIRRLQTNTAAKDRLIFALVDSIFLRTPGSKVRRTSSRRKPSRGSWSRRTSLRASRRSQGRTRSSSPPPNSSRETIPALSNSISNSRTGGMDSGRSSVRRCSPERAMPRTE
jgi:hypothetical protein